MRWSDCIVAAEQPPVGRWLGFCDSWMHLGAMLACYVTLSPFSLVVPLASGHSSLHSRFFDLPR